MDNQNKQQQQPVTTEVGETPNPSINPLNEQVIPKAYTKPNINTSGIDFTKPIPEPTFSAPPPTQPQQPKTPPPPKPEPINPQMKYMGKKDTQMAAAHVAGLIMQGYEWMHNLANKGLVVSENKLNKMQLAGEINLNATIDYDYGKKIRAGEFFKEYNEQAGTTLQVSDEFKEEVTPLLEKVLAARGIGISDEQMLLFKFSQDIGLKGILWYQQRSQMKYMIDSIKDATKNQYAPPPPPPPPQPQQSQAPTPQPEPAPAAPAATATEATTKPSGGGVKPDAIILPSKKRSSIQKHQPDLGL